MEWVIYYKVSQSLSESETTLLYSGVGITKWSSYYKVGQYMYERHIKDLVGKIYCPPPLLPFTYLAQGCVEVQVYKYDQSSLRVELYNMLKWSSEGTDLIRTIHNFVRAQTYILGVTRHEILRIAHKYDFHR